MNPQEEDRIKLKLYREFEEKNKELYRTNTEMYFHEQNRYVEKRFLEVEYNLKIKDENERWST